MLKSACHCTSLNCFIDQEVDLGELDKDEGFFVPLQRLLDQCRGVKVLTKYV